MRSPRTYEEGWQNSSRYIGYRVDATERLQPSFGIRETQDDFSILQILPRTISTTSLILNLNFRKPGARFIQATQVEHTYADARVRPRSAIF